MSGGVNKDWKDLEFCFANSKVLEVIWTVDLVHKSCFFFFFFSVF